MEKINNSIGFYFSRFGGKDVLTITDFFYMRTFTSDNTTILLPAKVCTLFYCKIGMTIAFGPWILVFKIWNFYKVINFLNTKDSFEGISLVFCGRFYSLQPLVKIAVRPDCCSFAIFIFLCLQSLWLNAVLFHLTRTPFFFLCKKTYWYYGFFLPFVGLMILLFHFT